MRLVGIDVPPEAHGDPGGVGTHRRERTVDAVDQRVGLADPLRHRGPEAAGQRLVKEASLLLRQLLGRDGELVGHPAHELGHPGPDPLRGRPQQPEAGLGLLQREIHAAPQRLAGGVVALQHRALGTGHLSIRSVEVGEPGSDRPGRVENAGGRVDALEIEPGIGILAVAVRHDGKELAVRPVAHGLRLTTPPGRFGNLLLEASDLALEAGPLIPELPLAGLQAPALRPGSLDAGHDVAVCRAHVRLEGRQPHHRLAMLLFRPHQTVPCRGQFVLRSMAVHLVAGEGLGRLRCRPSAAGPRAGG